MPELIDVLYTNTTRPDDCKNSDYDDILRHCVETLSQYSPRDLARPDILRALDPSTSTISYAFLLDAYISLSDPELLNTEDLLSMAVRFITSGDPVQLRYVGSIWRRVLEWVTQATLQSRNIQLLMSLRDAILHMDPMSATFTSNHLLFVRTCLELRVPRQALPLLNKDTLTLPHSINPSIDPRVLCSSFDLSSDYITKSSFISDDLAVQDIQEYYLLGARIYAGIRNYSRASLFLHLVLATPSNNNSIGALTVEAHKALHLISLLHNGTAYKPSSASNTASQRQLSIVSKPYEALSDAFTRRDFSKFQAEKQLGADIWRTDGNTGLVEEASEALRRYRVLDLQETYSALPVSHVASHLELSIESTTTLLTSMIRNGHLHATLSSPSQNSSVLRFSAQHSTDENTAQSIASHQLALEELSIYIQETDRRLSSSKEYVNHLSAQKRRAADVAKGVGSGAQGLGAALGGFVPTPSLDAGYEDGMNNAGELIDDEDLMAA